MHLYGQAVIRQSEFLPSASSSGNNWPRVAGCAGTLAPRTPKLARHSTRNDTPYFVPAAGIVMDMGGLLSHGSIIAREYGIPAVVNVGPATRIIRTGDLVEVDGDAGIVRILG